jgi:hypothetical protein
MAEASHESLSLAILTALVEAQCHSLTAGEAQPKSVPQVRPTQAYAICCDNFAWARERGKQWQWRAPSACDHDETMAKGGSPSPSLREL